MACIYRSPNLSSALNSVFISCLKNIFNESNVFETLLVGDFNLPDISWETCCLKNGNNCTSNKLLLQQLEYMDVFNQKGLKWSLVNEITRRRLVKGVLQESLLDQVLFTNDALVSSTKLLSSLGKSDHLSMKIELCISLNKPTNVNKSAIKKPSWSKISADEITKYSMDNIDWKYSCDQLSSDQMLNELQGKFDKIPSSIFMDTWSLFPRLESNFVLETKASFVNKT